MKFLLKGQAKLRNECSGKYNKIFRILEKDSLNLIQVWFEESYITVGDDMILEINGSPNPTELEQILKIKGVSVYDTNH